ncbi:MAG: hypothetical protein ABF826_13595 [Komagataeibacter saccharivorans]|uniref:hypothetical protein n=1 Tax=Komagataeibacter saccharivorans TaxID=265959 RepID=UPI0039E950E3
MAEKLFKPHHPHKQWNGQVAFAERRSGSDTPVSANYATPAEQAHFRALGRGSSWESRCNLPDLKE